MESKRVMYRVMQNYFRFGTEEIKVNSKMTPFNIFIYFNISRIKLFPTTEGVLLLSSNNKKDRTCSCIGMRPNAAAVAVSEIYEENYRHPKTLRPG